MYYPSDPNTLRGLKDADSANCGKHGDSSKLGLDTTRKVLQYLENRTII